MPIDQIVKKAANKAADNSVDHAAIPSVPERKPVINLENVIKDFKVGKNQVRVLRGLDLKIFAGEFVIMFGQSGCGKSTTLNTIMGLEPPTSGDVFVRDVNLYNLSDDERAKYRQTKFGMVSQQPNWIKSLNVVENVAYPLMISGAKRHEALARAKHALDVFGLAEYAKYTPTELSGGQQQKVSMCRAFMTNPWMLVADEPTGNLDSKSAEEVMNIFKLINEEAKRTILIVSHNLDYEKYASKLIYMKDGQIEEVVDKRVVNETDSDTGYDMLATALRQQQL